MFTATLECCVVTCAERAANWGGCHAHLVHHAGAVSIVAFSLFDESVAAFVQAWPSCNMIGVDEPALGIMV